MPDLAVSLDVDKNTVYRWERGEYEAPLAYLDYAVRHWGVSGTWLLTGKDNAPQQIVEPPNLEVVATKHYRPVKDAVTSGHYIAVPLLEDSVAAGPPAEVDENHIEGWALIYADRQWMPNAPDKYTCVRIRGRSMYPILDDGDLVAIDHAERPTSLAELKRLNGKMVAFRVNGGVTIKWLKFMEDQDLVVGVPENKDELDHLVVLQREQINDGIIGLVRWWWSKR